jgi:hypothetical protein
LFYLLLSEKAILPKPLEVSMKFLILFVTLTLTTSLFANSYDCKGEDSSGNIIKVKASTYAQTKSITLYLGSKNYKETIKLKFFSGSSMGHSRCPGTWHGVTFEGQNPKSIFKSLSIVTDEHFYGCGFPPSNAVTLVHGNDTEIIHLICKK